MTQKGEKWRKIGKCRGWLVGLEKQLSFVTFSTFSVQANSPAIPFHSTYGLARTNEATDVQFDRLLPRRVLMNKSSQPARDTSIHHGEIAAVGLVY